ncbi:MAG: helix-turn-helix transcriptional regulator [Sphingomicrobium sp.]
MHPEPTTKPSQPIVSRALLTDRQMACLEGVAQHKSAKEIGRDLGISNHAVEKHLKAARQKLGATSTIEALRIYRQGTVQPHYASSDLSPPFKSDHPGHADRVNDAALPAFSGRSRAVWEIEHELSPQQTLAAIGISVIGIVVVFALIMAIAQGAYAIWPR